MGFFFEKKTLGKGTPFLNAGNEDPLWQLSFPSRSSSKSGGILTQVIWKLCG